MAHEDRQRLATFLMTFPSFRDPHRIFNLRESRVADRNCLYRYVTVPLIFIPLFPYCRHLPFIIS